MENDFYGYDEVVRGVVEGLVDVVRREGPKKLSSFVDSLAKRD